MGVGSIPTRVQAQPERLTRIQRILQKSEFAISLTCFEGGPEIDLAYAGVCDGWRNTHSRIFSSAQSSDGLAPQPLIYSKLQNPMRTEVRRKPILGRIEETMSEPGKAIA